MQILFTPDEVAKQLSVSVKTLYDWIYRKRINYVKAGHLVRFTEDNINSFLKPSNQPTEPQKKKRGRPIGSGNKGRIDAIMQRVCSASNKETTC